MSNVKTQTDRLHSIFKILLLAAFVMMAYLSSVKAEPIQIEPEQIEYQTPGETMYALAEVEYNALEFHQQETQSYITYEDTSREFANRDTGDPASYAAHTIDYYIDTPPAPKNPALKRYHKMQAKMERNCSLCQPKGLRKLVPKYLR